MRGSGECFWRWDFPGPIDHESPSYIEVGKAAGQIHVEPIEAGDRIAESIACQRRRAGIHALAPGECALGLKAVAHAFGQLKLEGIKIGAPLIKHSAH